MVLTNHKCPKCNTGRIAEDDDELKCMNCGQRFRREAEAINKEPASNGANGTEPKKGIELTITLNPTNLPELFHAGAMARGYDSSRAYLSSKGVDNNTLARMNNGNVLHVPAILAVMQDLGVTPAELVKLMSNTRPTHAQEKAVPRNGQRSYTCPECNGPKSPQAKTCKNCRTFANNFPNAPAAAASGEAA